MHSWCSKLIPPGLEPGTLRVLDARDNHYTTESRDISTTGRNKLLNGNLLAATGRNARQEYLLCCHNPTGICNHAFLTNNQPLWRNGLARWTSNSKVVGSTPISGVVHFSFED